MLQHVKFNQDLMVALKKKKDLRLALVAFFCGMDVVAFLLNGFAKARSLTPIRSLVLSPNGSSGSKKI